MKRNVFTIFFLLVGLVSSAQDYVEIRNTLWPNTPQDVRAGKRITFWPGSKMSVASSVTSTAKIDPSLLGTSAAPVDIGYKNTGPFITGISTDLSVGSIAGQASVSGTGGSAYTIPIALPAGLNGLQPELSLYYNSFSGLGLLGEGFNLNGLSAITRGNKSLYHDGFLDDVEYLPKDAFYYNGQRLIVKTGSNGSDGAEYGTFIESFVKIRSHESTAYGPRRFTAETNSGQKIKFGSSRNSRIEINNPDMISTWLIDEVNDPFGNIIKYEYLHDEGSAYLKKISYNGNINGLSPYSEVVFNYRKREDQSEGFEKGKKIARRYLLTSIAVYHRQMLIKEYKMDYAYKTNSVLRAVRLFNADGEEVNATQFEFGDDERVVSTVKPSVLKGQIMSAEINGDGRTDLFSFHGKLGVDDCWVGIKNVHSLYYYFRGDAYINNGNGSFQKITVFNEFESGESAGDCVRRPIFNKASGDFNGDGFGDLVIVRKGAKKGIYLLQFYEFNPAKGRFNTPLNKNISFSEVDDIKGHIQLTVADFNKDGIDDLLCSREMEITSQNPAYEQVTNIFVTKWQSLEYEVLTWWTPNSSGSPASTFQPYGQKSVNADSIYVTDINGNGIPDIALVDNKTHFYEIDIDYTNSSGKGQCKFIPIMSTNVVSTNLKFWFGEFNGDGKTDILRYSKKSQSWSLLYTTGNSSTPFEQATYNLSIWHEPSEKDGAYKVADFDGDGLTDVLETRYDGSSRYCTIYYRILDKSSSFGFYGRRFTASNATFYWPEHAYHIGDFDGNGAADILLYDSMYTASSAILVDFGRNNSSYLKRVRDGLGNITTFNYEFFSPYSGAQGFQPLRSVQVSYPHSVRVWPMQLVKSKVQSFAGAHNETETYNYTDPVFHGTGLGFQGFKTVEVFNSLTEFTKTTVAEFVNESMLPKTTTLKYNGTLLSKSQSFNRLIKVNHTGAQPNVTTNMVLQNYRTTKQDYQKNISSTTEVKAYNSNFNPILTEELTYNDYSFSNLCQKLTKTITYTTAAGVWYPSFPELITTAKTLPGSPDQSVQQKYTYFSTTGKVKDNISFFGLPKALTTTSTYDGYGNLTSLTKSSQGRSRKSTFNYEPGTVQMINEVNNAGQKKEYAFHQLFDKSVEEIDILGNKVTFEYGGNGELRKSTSPTGIISTYKKEWAAGHSDAPAGALFYTETKSSEGSPDQFAFYNAAGQVLREVTYGLNNEKIFTDTEYDTKGRLIKVSEPYKANGSVVWVSRSYDNLNRLRNVHSTAASFTYTYAGNSITVVNQNSGKYKKATKDATGKLLGIDDNGSSITFSYTQTADRSITTIMAGANTMIQTFDIYGNQIQLDDADAGQLTYEYNGFREMTEQYQNGKLWKFTYDNLGRLKTKSTPEGMYTYEYGKNGANSKGQLSKATAPSGIEYHYYYDEYGRLAERRDKIQGVDYSFHYGYANQSVATSITYPSGFEVHNVYDANGFLTEVKKASGTGYIWRAGEANAMGQLTKYHLGNGLSTTKTFDKYHQPSTIVTGDVQDLEFLFEAKSGNLQWRKDNIHKLTESFDYDGLDQLTEIAGPNPGVTTLTYDKGRISSKSDVGIYAYYNGNNQVTEITNNPGSIPEFRQEVKYTAFNKISYISENTHTASFVYGPNQQRKIMSVENEDGNFYARLYIGGDYEIEDHIGKGKRRLHYISGGDGLAAICTMDENDDCQLYYVHKDYLGSILAITDEEGKLVEEYSFDAWGRRRNPKDWSYDDIETERLFDRGYTAHEHLFDGFNIINMNGRIYDPTVGMMMSPDNFVQDVTSSVNYNRYSYAVNNPLKYTDPSGEVYIWDDVIVGVVGFAVGYVNHGITTDDWGWDAVASGGISAATFLLGYYTGGASSQASIANGFASAGYSSHAATVALGYAGGATATRVLSLYAPSMSFNTGFGTISASPYIGIGPEGLVHGVNVGLDVPIFDSGSIGVGVGAGTNGGSQGLRIAHKSGLGAYVSSVGMGTSTAQTTAGLSINREEWSLRFENDVFALQGEDRWRTGGAEVTIGNFVFGSQVYTNDPKGDNSGINENGKSKIFGSHGNPIYGSWLNGVVSSSPVYIGYKNGNSIHRVGLNHPVVQDITQNGIHTNSVIRKANQHFYNQYTNYNGVYYQTGTYNPFSIYYY